MQKQNKIVPTFNKSKRPHQALYAHPKNANSSNAPFPGNGPSTSGSDWPANKQRRTAPNKQNFNRSQPGKTSFNNNNSRNSSWNATPSNSQRGTFRNSTYPNPWNTEPARSPSPGPWGSWGPPSGAETINSNSGWQQWAGPGYSEHPNRPPTQLRPPHPGGFPNQGPYPMYPPPQNLPPPYPPPMPQPRYPLQPSSPARTPYWMQNTAPLPPTPNMFPPLRGRFNAPRFQNSQRPVVSGRQGGKFIVDDRSLKVVTASIEDTKKWSQHTDKIGILICEVFGVLSSAITSDASLGANKTFTIKDRDQTLKCIFYETDRPLPRLIRDQWLRCVGSMDRRYSLFRCVSVRPANQSEQEFMKSLIASSSNIMKERLAAVQEP